MHAQAKTWWQYAEAKVDSGVMGGLGCCELPQPNARTKPSETTTEAAERASMHGAQQLAFRAEARKHAVNQGFMLVGVPGCASHSDIASTA